MPDDPFNYVHPATGCAKCPALVPGRHTVVWGSGPPKAEVMFIAEAPGQREDMEGRPFVGPAGQLLSELCMAAGIRRTEVHIANRLMCRPPGNRDPEPLELDNCEPWLLEHIRNVDPKLVVLFGRYALSWYFDKHAVADTAGLMYIDRCDWCGNFRHQGHRDLVAVDGNWRYEDPTVGMEAPHEFRTRLVLATYHPAWLLRDQKPENRAIVVNAMRRAMSELAHAKEHQLV